MTSEQRRVVLTLGFCGLVSAADNWFVSPALPAIAQTLAVAPSVVAVILTAYLVPYGALQPVCGAIGDRVGRVRLLRVIVAGLAVGTLVCALAPSLPALVAARILTGCFAAGIISVSQALVGDVVSAEDRAAAVGLLMGVTFTGQGLSAGLGGIITELVGWRAAFVCFGVLAVVAWLGVMRLRGVGEREEALKALAGELGMAERAHFLGFRRDVPALLRASDIFLFPSLQEGLPVAQMEAMAAGLPCVVSNVRGNADLIQPGEGGYLNAPRDWKGFSEDVKRLMADAPLRREMGNRNRRVMQGYSLDEALRQMAALYQELLARD